jgi:hypothetical protein
MNPEKQRRKLAKVMSKAQLCLTRAEAQKLIRQAEKIWAKLMGSVQA